MKYNIRLQLRTDIQNVHCRYTESIHVILDVLEEVRHMLGLSDPDYCNNTRTNLIPGSHSVQKMY